jgi:hypothetical protein
MKVERDINVPSVLQLRCCVDHEVLLTAHETCFLIPIVENESVVIGPPYETFLLSSDDCDLQIDMHNSVEKTLLAACFFQLATSTSSWIEMALFSLVS